jgi:hypothetical protein
VLVNLYMLHMCTSRISDAFAWIMCGSHKFPPRLLHVSSASLADVWTISSLSLKNTFGPLMAELCNVVLLRRLNKLRSCQSINQCLTIVFPHTHRTQSNFIRLSISDCSGSRKGKNRWNHTPRFSALNGFYCTLLDIEFPCYRFGGGKHCLDNGAGDKSNLLMEAKSTSRAFTLWGIDALRLAFFGVSSFRSIERRREVRSDPFFMCMTMRLGVDGNCQVTNLS